MIIVPNVEDAPAFQAQAYPDRLDLLDIRNLSDAGTGVVSGCQVSAHGTPDFAVAVASGSVQTAFGTPVTVATVSSLAPLVAANTTDRKDLIVVDGTTGIPRFVTGTPTLEPSVPWTDASSFANPVKPPIPAGTIPLAEAYIEGGSTTITAVCLYDKSPIVQRAGSVAWTQGQSAGNKQLTNILYFAPAIATPTASSVNANISGGPTFTGSLGNICNVVTFTTGASGIGAGIELFEVKFSPSAGIGHVPAVLVQGFGTPTGGGASTPYRFQATQGTLISGFAGFILECWDTLPANYNFFVTWIAI
ncbi:MAG: hypothetical protein KGH75_00015 [Rhodospirillales bacterium]|nr:hypothetical protein [Rhodospirillales bacterium]